MTEQDSKQALSWNEQLKQWYQNSEYKGKGMDVLGKACGIARSTLGDYMAGRMTELSRMSPDKRKKLHDLTKLDCFIPESAIPPINMDEPAARKPYTPKQRESAPSPLEQERTLRALTGESFGEALKVLTGPLLESQNKGIDGIIESMTKGIGIGPADMLDAGMVMAQVYRPTPERRIKAISQLMTLLTEEIDYFRTHESEAKVLTEEFKRDSLFGENLRYITQMYNIIAGGKGMDTWMKLAQPPSIIRKASGDKK